MLEPRKRQYKQRTKSSTNTQREQIDSYRTRASNRYRSTARPGKDEGEWDLIQLGYSSKSNIATPSREYGYLLFLESSTVEARLLRQIPEYIFIRRDFGRSAQKRLNDLVGCRSTGVGFGGTE